MNPNACPKCGSGQIEGSSVTIGVDLDKQAAWQEMSCLMCDASWEDIYVYSYRVVDDEIEEAS